MNTPALLCLSAACLALAASAAEPNAPTAVNRDLLAKARKILRGVPLVDGHNDLPWQFHKHGDDLGFFDLRVNGRGLAGWPVTDIPRLREGEVGAQFWSVYVPAELSGPAAVQEVLKQIDFVHRMVAAYPDTFELAGTADDIERIHRHGRIASLIGMEGGHSIGGSLATLRMMYDLGARYMTLTHTKTTEWADSANDKPLHHGLTPFGEDVVREMNRIGMLVDISHVSDDTMRAALKISQAPVIFSHSSARALCDNPRDVPDDVLRLLPQNGGVVMVCFVPGFTIARESVDMTAHDKLEDELEAKYGENSKEAREQLAAWRQAHPAPEPGTLADVANHIDHIREVAGIDHIGIGSDFDGFHGSLLGLEDVSTYPALFAELLRRGYSKEDVRKIAGENVIRALRQTEKVSASLRGAK
ncbi:MAG TPA: dipeptidase [Verrucomicrobiae bacterium]|nr:dipeptidase [Verrucomicrobiae bacterium]